MRGIRAAGAVLFTAAVLAGGVHVVGGSLGIVGGGGGGVSNVANLWIDTDGGTCTRQTTAGSYVDAGACSTFAAACAAASGGDNVRIKAGTYAAETLHSTGAGTTCAPSSTLTFQPASGESVTMSGTLNDGDGQNSKHGSSHLTFRDFTVGNAISLWEFADDIQLINMTAKHWNCFGCADTTGLTVTGGDYGNCTAPADDANCNIKIDVGQDYGSSFLNGWKTPTNITISGGVYHDMISTNLGTNHAECMFIRGGSNITIDGAQFYNCHVYDIFMQGVNYGVANQAYHAHDVIIRNSWFDAPYSDAGRTTHDHRAIAFADSNVQWENWLIQYNSFHNSDVQENDNGTSQAYSNFRIIANIMKGCTSYSGITYDRNAYTAASGCGTNKLTSISEPYVSATNGSSADYHLTGSSSAENYVSESGADYALATDYDGASRNAPRDAGSDDR